jgi:hypothetical protein
MVLETRFRKGLESGAMNLWLRPVGRFLCLCYGSDTEECWCFALDCDLTAVVARFSGHFLPMLEMAVLAAAATLLVPFLLILLLFSFTVTLLCLL